MTNSRNKGAAFEREIANLLNEELELTIPLKRILILGRWHLECKRYGQGNEPIENWWNQVLDSIKERELPALIYKFNNRPIKVRVPLYSVNPSLDKDNFNTCDLLWKDFVYLIKTLYQEDIKSHKS